MDEVDRGQWRHLLAGTSERFWSKPANLPVSRFQDPVLTIVAVGLFDDSAFPGIQRLVAVEEDDIYGQVGIYPVECLRRSGLNVDPEGKSREIDH